MNLFLPILTNLLRSILLIKIDLKINVSMIEIPNPFPISEITDSILRRQNYDRCFISKEK
jgi:hypothetical protein